MARNLLCIISLLFLSLCSCLNNNYSLSPVICDEELVKRYSTPVPAKNQKDREWCVQTMRKYGTVIGKRWGPMSKELRDIWSESNCEELIQFQTLFSCNRRLGWGFFDYWLAQRSKTHRITDGIECISSNKANRFCKLSNATVNFQKVKINGEGRDFYEGFVESHGTSPGNDSPVPGYRHVKTMSLDPKDITGCDRWETRPTFVLSNDDPFNLSHYMNDVIMIWSMLVLAGVKGSDAILINMDGIRVGGPAGGSPHRIIVPNSPDNHGPFSAYFESWFQTVYKSTDFSKQSICFKEIYFQYFPGYSWFWNDWTMDNSCSYSGPSPIYQSFSLHLRQKWIEKYGPNSLPNPPTDHLHIVIELREINPHKRESYPRYILNSDLLIEALKGLENVQITVQNFAKISFEKQVALSHSANIFISMHGAGTANMFHSAIGQPNCCTLIELFPDTSSHFHSIRGFGNLARHYGMHYYRYQARDGETTSTGTKIDIERFLKIVQTAMKDMAIKPSCLNNATDQTVGKFLSSFPMPLTQTSFN